MNNSLEKRQRGGEISTERRKMNEALMRLDRTEPAVVQRAASLVVGLDLTASREARLYEARIATGQMFDAIKSIGSIRVKLVYYRGESECRATDWHGDASELSERMRRLTCETGFTQIERVLRFTSAAEGPSALVFIGDHCEEDRSGLVELAANFAVRGIPIFVFHECADDDVRSIEAKPTFKGIAHASGGVYTEFKPDSGQVLRELLSSVAAFAADGAAGLKHSKPETHEARELQKSLLLLPAPQTSLRRRS